jgi:hypothetical protein
LASEGDLLIEDDKNNKLGFDNGKFVNTIPGATVYNQTHELTFWDDKQDPVYRLPLGVPAKITLDGTGLAKDSMSHVFLTAPGYTFAVQDVLLSPGQKDTIEFSAGCDTVHYVTNSSETPVLELGAAFQGADYLFAIAVAGESNGVDAKLYMDVPKGQLAVDINAQDGHAVFGVVVLRAGDQGVHVFKHIGNTIASSAVVYLEYGTWAGDGTPMTFGTDADGDGSVDSTAKVSDDG